MKICGHLFRTVTALLMGMLAIQYSGISVARDSTQNHSINDAMETATAKSFSDVKFFFGDQPHPEPNRHIGSYNSKRTTNAFGKSDYESCQWAFLSAIKSFYERALAEGGDAVVNIKSITTGRPFESTTEFVCRAGNVVTKVYLRGDVVEL
jgi:hypothetical protein